MSDFKNISRLKANFYTRIAQVLIIVFIAIGFVVGFLNSVLSKRLDPSMQDVIHISYILYEHIARTLIVIFFSFITIKRLKLLKKTISRFRIVSLSSFCASLLILLVIVPILANSFELFLLFMPFPWSTAPFQLILTGSVYNTSFINIFGEISVQISLIIYIIFQVVVFTGVVLFGRRWFCSLICPMNGCHAESFGDFLPLITLDKERPKSKAVKKKVKKFLKIFQIVFIVVNLLLILAWILVIFDVRIIPSLEILKNIELYKYLMFELILMLLGWMVIGGRSYCYYCPAGTFIGIIGRISGQKILTGLTQCTECGLCNDACKMSIDILSRASKGEPVKSIDCVGCGLCIEACPQSNLQYTTYFLKKIKNQE
ncbi:MAG: 4Fe-4S binding protein [Candidatus Lokiarchaeota archaeon]|nr:4Fe-4S binding protein [Candidatus Lokiarchaeota archaeon]